MARILLVLLCCLWSNLAVSSDGFIKAIESENWNEAKKSSKKFKTLATWLELSKESDPDFYDLKNFLEQHPNWPQASNFKRKIEESSFVGAKNSDVIAWFKKYPPKTISGKKKYLNSSEDEAIKAKYAKEVWVEANFTSDEQENFLKKYGKFLSKEKHIARLDYLLFNKKIEQANRMLPYVPSKLLDTYKTRINIQQGKLDYSKASSNDIGVLYDIASIYNNKDDEENLIKILKTSSKIDSPYQHYFWKMKSRVIRDLIKEKDYKSAYLFSKSHGDLDRAEYSEAEWLSGWISLRFLDNPKNAVTHFTNMYNKVSRPISVSRASYWLARSYEALNDNASSEYWYVEAAKYYTSFYGQLAVCKINDCKVNIANDPEVTDLDKKNFDNNILIQSALILHKSKKYKHLVQSFLLQAIDNSKSLGEVSLITKLGMDLNHQHLSVEAAKHASYKDIMIIHSSYPILKSVSEHALDPALVMALIRQESVFNHKAVSSAGAMGLMQLMPHVAKETAKNLNISYKKDKLSDPHFNTKLGTSHLDKLVTCYNPSYILSIAAYNAGDKPVLRWLNNGDPRLMEDIEDIVDWIERISFYETRNYVQRVLEGKSIYHVLMTKQNKLPLLKDLTEGSGEGCLVASN